MKNNRFWNWVRNEETGASEMYLYGAIAESTWFENDITQIGRASCRERV